jgi:hypothetical protein
MFLNNGKYWQTIVHIMVPAEIIKNHSFPRLAATRLFSSSMLIDYAD